MALWYQVYIRRIRMECVNKIVIHSPILRASTVLNKNSHRSKLVRTILLLCEHFCGMRASGIVPLTVYYKYNTNSIVTLWRRCLQSLHSELSHFTPCTNVVVAAMAQEKTGEKILFQVLFRNIAALRMLLLLWNLIIGFGVLGLRFTGHSSSSTKTIAPLLRYCLGTANCPMWFIQHFNASYTSRAQDFGRELWSHRSTLTTNVK